MNNNDINKKLEDLLAGMNPEVIKKSKQGIDKILRSPQGQDLAKNLSGADKQKLMQSFMNMSNDEIRNKLKNVKMSDLSNLSADEILKKLS